MVLLPFKNALGIGDASGAHLSEVTGAASNPGGLRGWSHVPRSIEPGAALVVALHGCTQTAAGFDRGTGWSTLAEREGFAVLLPEQVRANNPNGCFNWFQPGDVARTGGEAESIAAMTRALMNEHAVDPGRVFVTGLSAGGAMAAAMLATYPDLFAGGAIIGGLPYRCASGVPEAMAAMRGGGTGDARAVGTAAGGHRGPWPTVSVWHGSADAVVVPHNMDAAVGQWLGVHGIDPAAGSTERRGGRTHRTWRGADGRIAVESRLIDGMGHGVPIDPSGSDRLGAAGAYMLDVGVSSTAEIARFWGLVDETRAATERPANDPVPAGPSPAAGAAGVGRVIEDALRTAGLMR